MKKNHLFSQSYKAAFSLFLKEQINESSTGSRVKDVYYITELWDDLSEEEKIRYDSKAKELMKQQLESMKLIPIKFVERVEEPVEESPQAPRKMKRLAYSDRKEENEEELNKEESELKDAIKDQLDQDGDILSKVSTESNAEQQSKPKMRMTDSDNSQHDQEELKNGKNKSRKHKSEKNKKQQQYSDEIQRSALTDTKQIKIEYKNTNRQSSDEDDIEMSKKMKKAEKRYQKKIVDTGKENDVLIVKDNFQNLIKHFQNVLNPLLMISLICMLIQTMNLPLCSI